MAKDEDQLSDREEKYCQNRMLLLNKTEAARRAGYSDKSGGCRCTAVILERRPRVQRRLQELRAKAAKRYDIDEDRVIGEIARVAFANPLDYVQINPDGQATVDLSELNEAEAAAIAEVRVEERFEGQDNDVLVRRTQLKFHPKLPALEKLGARLDLFKEKVEVDAGDKLIKALEKAHERVRRGQE